MVKINKKVAFNNIVKVRWIAFDRKERQSPWMREAADRKRFERKIKNYEPILNEVIRKKINQYGETHW